MAVEVTPFFVAGDLPANGYKYTICKLQSFTDIKITVLAQIHSALTVTVYWYFCMV